MAKGLASGLPIGAVMTTRAVAGQLVIGDLGSTFGGGPVPCAAALATIGVIEREGLMENVRTVGAHLTAGALALGIPGVQGRGLLLGLRLGRPAAAVQRRCSSSGFSPAPRRIRRCSGSCRRCRSPSPRPTCCSAH